MERFRRALVLFALVTLVSVAGCTATSDSGGHGSTVDASPSSSEREQAASALESATDDYEAAAANVVAVQAQARDARADGVETATSDGQVAVAERARERALTRLTDARDAFDSGRYGAVAAPASASRQASRDTNAAAERARSTLEDEYNAALRASKAALRESYDEYQVAVATVAAAEQRGAEMGSAVARLETLRAQLEDGRTAVSEERSPARATAAATLVSSESRAIRDEAVDAVERRLADAAIAATAELATDDRARTWLADARSASEAGDPARVRIAVTQARQAQQLADADAYLGAIQQREGWTVEPLDERTRYYRGRLEDGEQPVGLAGHVGQVERASACYDRIVAADRAIHEANGYDSLLVNADTDAAADRVADARAALESGNVSAACGAATDAAALADAEAATLRAHTQTDVLAGVYRSVRDAVLGPFGLRPTAPEPLATFDTVDSADDAAVDLTFEPPQVETERLAFDDSPIALASSQPSAGGAAEPPDFESRIDAIEECGTTCRVVTATVENVGGSTAHNVVADYTVSTRSGKAVYRGTEHVGMLRPGETRTVTKRVTVGYFDGLDLKQNGGTGELELRSTEHDETHQFPIDL